jgi:uncharacterized RDD family membrane protein YckC
VNDWREPEVVDAAPEGTRLSFTPVRGRRVAAGFIDLVPLTIVALALSDRESSGGGVSANLSGARFFLAIAVVLAYYFVSELLTATTPGKWLLGLTVVDEREQGPSGRAVAVRTVLRLVDGLPVLYLVGFVVMLASPLRQRVGDMVASTRVILRADLPLPARTRSSRRNATVLGVVAAVTFGAGIVGLVASAGTDEETVGAFGYDADVVPFVDETMVGIFRDQSADTMIALFVDGAATPDQAQESITRLQDYSGALIGDWTITEHHLTDDVRVDGVADRVDVAEVRVLAEFANGPAEVFLAVADVDDEMRLISWNINLLDG